MKAYAMGMVAWMGLLVVATAGCVTRVDESTADEDVSADDESQIICQDLVVHESQSKFCGFQTGPLDDSPVNVLCTRTCVTERHIVLGGPGPFPSITCVSGDRDCDAWDCPSCD